MTMRGHLPRLYGRLLRYTQRARGAVVSTMIRLGGGRVGPGLRVDGNVRIRHFPHAGWSIGENVYIGIGVVLDVAPSAKFHVGDGVKIMHHTVLGCSSQIMIGREVQIAESCSVRDSNHDVSRGISLMHGPAVASPVQIEPGAWVGRGVAVLAGSTIGARSVIGANSVVRESIPADYIFAGAPARPIRPR